MSWSDFMATVHPCGHTEAQHQYADAGYFEIEPCDGRVVKLDITPASEAGDAGPSPALSTRSVVEGSPLDHDCPMELCGRPKGQPCGVRNRTKKSAGVPHFHLDRLKLTRKNL